MISWLYRTLWTRWPGRPWTYVIRQTTQESPAIVLVATLAVGILVGAVLPPLWWAVIVPAFFAGILFGHLYWDTRGTYIKPRA